MASKYPEEERSSMFECAICLQDMLNSTPKALPCLHTFCMECIQGLPSNNNKITCPSCRQECDLRKGVQDLPDNFHIRNMVSGMRESSQNCLGCGVSGKFSKVTHHCPKCNINMCDLCTGVHETRFGENHGVYKLSDTEKPKCNEHSSYNIQYFCSDCQELLCPLCVLYGTHSSHLTNDLDEMSENIEKSLKKIPKILKNKRLLLQSVSDKLKLTQGINETVKKQIQQTANTLKDQIDKAATGLLEQCKQEGETQINDMVGLTQKVEQDLVMIQKCDPTEKISQLNRILLLNRDMPESFNLTTYTFDPNDRIDIGKLKCDKVICSLADLKMNLGIPKMKQNLAVTVQDEFPLNIVALEEGEVIYTNGTSCRRLDKCGNTKVTYSGLERSNMHCIVLYGDYLFAFYESRPHILVQNIDRAESLIHLPNPKYVTNEVVMWSNNGYVSLCSIINTLHFDGTRSFITGLNKATGIASYQNETNQQMILVADNDGKCVKMFNLDGKKTNEFQYTEGRIIRMCVKDRNTLLVLNDNNMIQEIDMADGGIRNEDLIDSVIKEKITTFSYCKPYLWIAVNKKLIRFK